jgi:hypothetical protein
MNALSGSRLLYDRPLLARRGVRHADMSVAVLGLSILAHFYRLYPWIVQDVVDAWPQFGIRSQHALDDVVAFLGHQVV